MSQQVLELLEQSNRKKKKKNETGLVSNNTNMERDTGKLVTAWTFCGKEYVINMEVVSDSNMFHLCLVDKITAEEWRGEYSEAGIEQMAAHTGSSKEFHVFVTMLQAALLKNTRSLGLDLFTYAELQDLHNKRMAHRSAYLQPSPQINREPHPLDDPDRRYLILTYRAEFDRVYYPLLLKYAGLPDAKVLQAKVVKLEGEVDAMQKVLSGAYPLGVEWQDENAQLKEVLRAQQQENSKLREKNVHLSQQVAQLEAVQAKLRARLEDITPTSSKSEKRSHCKTHMQKSSIPLSPMRRSSQSITGSMELNSERSHSQSHRATRDFTTPHKGMSMTDFLQAEECVRKLQKMLQGGLDFK